MAAALDSYMPDPHSRSASVSSSSDPSRPPSSHARDMYRQYTTAASAAAAAPPHALHIRHSSSSTVYSLPSNGITTPGDSPPAPHTVASNAAIKPQMAVRNNPHLRHARAAASPYAREPHSHSGSEAEQDDLAMYLSSTPSDYMYLQSHHHHHQQQQLSQDPPFATRMTLTTDMTLEHLANNVRAATTTSASDRAKQIFVQAWQVPPPPSF